MSGQSVASGVAATRWTVISEPRMTRKGAVALARCACGTEREVRVKRIEDGRSRSCGCLASELRAQRMASHGMSYTPEYQTWADMLQRCTNPNVAKYADYGARGVTVCARWAEDFTAFYADMGPRPKGRTLDRIDVNGHYEPANCRWATVSEQNANRRPRESCRNGHRYTPENTRWRTKLGRRHRQCIACAEGVIL